MNTNHTQENSETRSTTQADEQQVWEQMDLFEWAGVYDESCVGFAVRSGF
jgi:hypothetical protein